MLPRGAAPLLKMRTAGHKPAGSVWVSYGDFVEPNWTAWAGTSFAPEIVVLPTDPLERLDFRCLFGLHVILFFADYSAATGRLYERLQEYAAGIDVLSPAFGDDIGWHWTRYGGQRTFNTRESKVA